MHLANKKIQVLLPAHNESGNIKPIYQEITEALSLTPCAYCILFIDDGSTDNTLQVIKDLAEIDPRVKFIELSRNFGTKMRLKQELTNANQISSS